MILIVASDLNRKTSLKWMGLSNRPPCWPKTITTNWQISTNLFIKVKVNYHCHSALPCHDISDKEALAVFRSGFADLRGKPDVGRRFPISRPKKRVLAQGADGDRVRTAGIQ